METPIDEKARKSCIRWLIMFKLQRGAINSDGKE